jgi:hypothetical protein
MRGDEANSELCAPVEQLVELAGEELGYMSVRRRAEGFSELLLRRSTLRSRKRIALSVAAVLIAVVTAFGGRRWLDSRHVAALSYTVDSGHVGQGGVIVGNGSTQPTLRFSDGTEVVFLTGSRGQVRSVDEHGARIAVAGKAKVEVVHWRGSHWLFDVGPFLITVTGTAFTAEWNDAQERLEVVLKTGTIAVSGPSSDEAITLRAGQRLIVSMRDKEVVIRDIESTGETGRAPSVVFPPSTLEVDGSPSLHVNTPPPATHAHLSPATTARSGSKTAPLTTNWRTQLAAGEFARILREAEQQGIDAALDGVSSDELAALADAARYSRREDIARRALMSQRRRFVATPHANDAAFLLGRLEEAAQHFAVALAWYERCLDESPSGTYTSESLGRKMTIVARLYGAARARPIAEAYLRRFEKGTYAAAARALVRTP